MVLPDYLSSGLRVVICGTASGTQSAHAGHYYSGRGNDFWRLLFDSGLTRVRLEPSEDSRIAEFGIGLTDLAKVIAANSDRGIRHHIHVEDFVRKMARFRPGWIAFHGKTAAAEVSRLLNGPRDIHLGRQRWAVAESHVFVIPSASGANRDPRRLEGKSSRLEWFKELRRTLDQ